MEEYFPHFKKPIMCQYCKQYTIDPLWVNRHIGRHTMQYAFCNLDHANKWYISHLNGGAL